jgi:hypothetical protein
MTRILSKDRRSGGEKPRTTEVRTRRGAPPQCFQVAAVTTSGRPRGSRTPLRFCNGMAVVGEAAKRRANRSLVKSITARGI